jgi:phosphoenolpyruvate synthase/pyruvate phosphate dikinase
VAEGRAFVARGLDDLDQLEAGDILVCPTTSPAWTPWLGLIAGAVVETGGMLSHTAILAREYGIPCVVNVREATGRIASGSRILVDGSAGIVRWLD